MKIIFQPALIVSLVLTATSTANDYTEINLQPTRALFRWKVSSTEDCSPKRSETVFINYMAFSRQETVYYGAIADVPPAHRFKLVPRCPDIKETYETVEEAKLVLGQATATDQRSWFKWDFISVDKSRSAKLFSLVIWADEEGKVDSFKVGSGALILGVSKTKE